MLQLSCVSESLPDQIELDDYIPLIVKWGKEEDLKQKNHLLFLPKLYWSISAKYSLLEIGIEMETQIIRVLKVVEAGRSIVYDSQIHIDPRIPSRSGMPICHTADWSSSGYFTNDYFREDGQFDFHVGKNHVCVIFSSHQIVSQIVSRRVRFCLDQNNYLSMLEVGQFSDEEMVRLIDTLKHYQASADLRM